jgi:hypothetical protein
MSFLLIRKRLDTFKLVHKVGFIHEFGKKSWGPLIHKKIIQPLACHLEICPYKGLVGSLQVVKALSHCL